MKTVYKHMIMGLILATGSLPGIVMAESDSATGGGNLSAVAHLNLRVTIPRFLHFRVGSAGGTINEITFAPTDVQLGDGNPIAGTGGDAAAGSGASVAVRSNGGQITITETNGGGAGGLGPGGAISLAEITVTSDNGALDTPVLSDSNSNTSTPTLNGGNVTSRTATWTYAYNNTSTPADGSYTAQIIYTAANF